MQEDSKGPAFCCFTPQGQQAAHLGTWEEVEALLGFSPRRPPQTHSSSGDRATCQRPCYLLPATQALPAPSAGIWAPPRKPVPVSLSGPCPHFSLPFFPLSSALRWDRGRYFCFCFSR